jgi:hypothetical protein
VLNENSIESDKPVYGTLTVAELVEEVFKQLQGTKDGDDLY